MKKLTSSPFFRTGLVPRSAVTDRIIIFSPVGDRQYKANIIDLHGVLPLRDKLIRLVCTDDVLDSIPADSKGPFYIGPITNPEVGFSCNTFSEFREDLNKEFFSRTMMSMVVEDDGVPVTVTGRAKNITEFEFLYLTDTEYMKYD